MHYCVTPFWKNLTVLKSLSRKWQHLMRILLLASAVVIMTFAKIKLTYFNIMGAAEKVRLAFAIKGIPFEDNRIAFPDWAGLKPSTKFGQLPIMTLPTGEEIAQSDAMLRYVATLPAGACLMPADPLAALTVDEVLGLAADMDKDWSPCLYISMRPENYGYPPEFKNTPEHQALIKRMRETFMNEKMPTYMKYYENFLGDKSFICGPDVSIADCVIIPQLYKFMQGNLDYVGKDSLDRYPKILAYMKRFAALPGVRQYENSKGEGVSRMDELTK